MDGRAEMKKTRKLWKEYRAWLCMGLPLIATVGLGCVNLLIRMQQGFIGIMLIWFQVSLMAGFFS
jgi:hypothetical protein